MYSYHSWIWQLADWPNFKFDSVQVAAHLARARQSQSKLLGKVSAIGLEGLQNTIVEALTQEAVTTSTIEGETINPQSVRSSIAKRLGLDRYGAATVDHKIEGLVDILQDASTAIDEPLTLDRMCTWHRALFPTGYSGLHKIDVGTLRTLTMKIISGPIGKSKIHFEAPPAEVLHVSVQKFVEWFNTSHPKTGASPLDGMIRACISHLWFETLHPFDDGNGRIGRAILQLALGQDMGAPACIVTLSHQIERQRNEYYQQLQEAQAGVSLNITPWVVWMTNQIGAACEFAEVTLNTSLERIRFLAKISPLPLNTRQRKSLSKLLEAGPSGFEGGMTTRKHASLCKTSKPTAARDLTDMANMGVIVSVGSGRSTRYYPAIEGWGELD
jgi:Fic family protein